MQLIDMAAQSGDPQLLMMIADTIASAVMSASGGGAPGAGAPGGGAPMAAEPAPMAAAQMPPMGANGMRMPYYKSGGAIAPQTALQKLVEKRKMASGGKLDGKTDGKTDNKTDGRPDNKPDSKTDAKNQKKKPY